MNYLLSDTSFWAFVGLILFFVVIIFVGAPKMIGKALDDRADLIRKERNELLRQLLKAQAELEMRAAAEADLRKLLLDVRRSLPMSAEVRLHHVCAHPQTCEMTTNSKAVCG